MSNGIRLDGLPSMQELSTVLHQELCQGRHILPLENVPNCSCPSVPVANTGTIIQTGLQQDEQPGSGTSWQVFISLRQTTDMCTPRWPSESSSEM